MPHFFVTQLLVYLLVSPHCSYFFILPLYFLPDLAFTRELYIFYLAFTLFHTLSSPLSVKQTFRGFLYLPFFMEKSNYWLSIPYIWPPIMYTSRPLCTHSLRPLLCTSSAPQMYELLPFLCVVIFCRIPSLPVDTFILPVYTLLSPPCASSFVSVRIVLSFSWHTHSGLYISHYVHLGLQL